MTFWLPRNVRSSSSFPRAATYRDQYIDAANPMLRLNERIEHLKNQKHTNKISANNMILHWLFQLDQQRD